MILLMIPRSAIAFLQIRCLLPRFTPSPKRARCTLGSFDFSSIADVTVDEIGGRVFLGGFGFGEFLLVAVPAVADFEAADGVLDGVVFCGVIPAALGPRPAGKVSLSISGFLGVCWE